MYLPVIALFFAIQLVAGLSMAQVNAPVPELEGLETTEHLGAQLPLDATFRDHTGANVRLSNVLNGTRPAVLVFMYHSCPMLCSLVLDGMTKSLVGVPWTVGNQYDVVAISIDPNDTPEIAEKKREQILGSYKRPESAAGWHFLVGDERQVARVADAVGFKYRYDPRQKQYAHGAEIVLLTNQAKVARYLYGIEFPSSDIRLGLLEASEGRSISTIERALIYCFHYDPQGKRYAVVAMNVMRLGGAITLAFLGAVLGLMWLRERRAFIMNKFSPAVTSPLNLSRKAEHTSGLP